jgi:NFU1 iron-sulfur cluster scaffold homolog, mitochondrial
LFSGKIWVSGVRVPLKKSIMNVLGRFQRGTWSKPIFASHFQQYRSTFINVEATPNPHSMKFIPSLQVLPDAHGTGMYFDGKDKRELLKSPLAKTILEIRGLKSVFLGKDFITVTKENDSDWQQLKPSIFTRLLNFFTEDNYQVIATNTAAEISDTSILDTDSEVVAAIKELIETRVRPSVQEDGGDIFYVGFELSTGIVKVKLAGSCVGCPSSSVTLRNGVENMLMHYIPEVKGIEEVTDVSEAFNANEEAEKRGEGGELKLHFKPDFVDPSRN